MASASVRSAATRKTTRNCRLLNPSAPRRNRHRCWTPTATSSSAASVRLYALTVNRRPRRHVASGIRNVGGRRLIQVLDWGTAARLVVAKILLGGISPTRMAGVSAGFPFSMA
jgi:hypothetical protein